MLTFLRKIRKSLLDSGSKRYFLYAIGEIALVVVGILIALQINNWNEDRKDRNEEKKILLNLKEEYESNLSQLDEKILMRKKIILFSSDILSYIDNPENVSIDTLVYKLGELGTDPTFDPISNDLISSGKIRLIQNDTLSKLLINWSSDVIALQEMEQYWSNITLNINLPLLINMGILRNCLHHYWSQDTPAFVLDKSLDYTVDIGKSLVEINPKSILINPELEGIASNGISSNHLNNLQSFSLRNRILEILDLIEKEIADRWSN